MPGGTSAVVRDLGSFSIVIVSYNTASVLRGCLASLAAARAPGDEVIVVDNASADGSAAMIRAEFPDVRLIANATNVGFGAASNQGIAAATRDLGLLLNPDARVDAAALDGLRRVLGGDRAALVGPRLLNADRTVQRSAFRFPTPLVLLAEQMNLGPRLRWLNPGDVAGQDLVPVDWLKGACLAAPVALLRAHGPFDERFFMFSEDTDLCFRLGMAGVPVLYFPAVAVVHLGGMSTRLRPRAMTVLFVDSTYLFHRKHSGARVVLLAAVALRSTASLKALRALVRAALGALAGRAPDARRDRAAARTFLAVALRSPGSATPFGGPGA